MAVNVNFIKLQQIKFNLFQSQNPENGKFDVIFEIGGKKLYAHKTMLTLVSDTFATMLSDRWTSKYESIELKDFIFDEYYQFFTFLYSAQYKLTDENIFSMIDLAEFYNVPLFKTYCDEYLSKMKFSNENILKMLELAKKYNMTQLKTAAETFMINNFTNFADSDEFMKLEKSDVEEIFVAYKNKLKPENLFKGIYKWAENRVNDSIENRNDAIKSEICDFLSHVDFSKMNIYFFMQSVVPKSFIFSSPDELSKHLWSCYPHPKIAIKNSKCHFLYGNLINDDEVIKNVRSLYDIHANARKYDGLWWDKRFTVPSTPSPLQKRDGVEHYLVYLEDGRIAVEPSSCVGTYYLLAELEPGNKETKFAFNSYCKIHFL